ncbi:MAG: hypothetical protein Q8Q20_04175 [bacterium]|nr:hypothetical protein [bacterium]
MKKRFFGIFVGMALLAIPWVVRAAPEVTVYFFYGEGCPHCAKEEQFLENIVEKYPEVEVRAFETWSDRGNARLMEEAAETLEVTVTGVPFTIIGGQYGVGYNTDESTGAAIEQRIQQCLEEVCADPLAELLSGEGEVTKKTPNTQYIGGTPDSIDVPFFGRVDVSTLSLPILTLVIAAIDGFNPCAMWALLFLISLLFRFGDRRRMWILGGAFIGVSGLVYFFFLAAWLNVFLFIGITRWLQITIALVALWAGYYHLRRFWESRQGLVCKVSDAPKRRKVFDRLRLIIERKNIWLALAGVVMLGAVVNLIELLCSAGLPAVYTSVLAQSGLTGWQYYGYLLLYILVFMLDDMIVFSVAMVTLRATGIGGGKYSRYASLIGGLVMLLIGVLLIVRPGWLMFG